MSSRTIATSPVTPDEAPLRRKGPSPLKKAGNYLVMIVITLVFVAPILYMVIGSFKPSDKVLNGLAGFIPEDMSLDNYSGVFARFNSPATGYFYNFYLTSLIVSVVIVVGGLVVNSMAAYALARLRWRGRNGVLLAVILGDVGLSRRASTDEGRSPTAGGGTLSGGDSPTAERP